MKVLLKSLFHLFVLTGLSLLMVTNAYSFDLNDAWQAAKEYDAGYRAAVHGRNAGKQKAAQGRAQLLPQISAGASWGSNETVKPKTSRQYETHGWRVTATQPLFDVTKFAAYRQGKSQAKIAEKQFDYAEQGKMVEVAQAYFELLLVHDTLDATRAAKSAYLKQLERAKTAFNVGAATAVDIDEAQANYDAAVAKEINAQSELDIKGGTLAMLSGLNPAQIQTVDGNKVLVYGKGQDLAFLQDYALKTNPEIQAKEESLKYSQQELLGSRGNRLPKIQATGTYTDTVNNTPSSFWNPTTHLNQGYSVSIEATIPLFAGGALHSQTKESKSKVWQAQDELEATRRKVREDIRKSYLGLVNGEAEVKATEQLLKSMQSKVNSTKLGSEYGIRTSLDLLDAQTEYYQTIQTLAQVRYKYLLAQLQLAQAVGILDEGVLKKTNEAVRKID